MSIRVQPIKFSVIAFCLFLTACIPSVIPTMPSTIPISQITPSVTPSVSTTRIPAGTSTIIPKPTNISFPTLANDVQDRLYGLLKNNGGCELPCFLGIKPGATSWSETKSFMDDFSISKPINLDNKASTETLNVYHVQIITNKEVVMMLNIRFDVDANNLVQHIILKMETRGDDGSFLTDDQRLSRYSLYEIFRRHGVPDVVVITPVIKGIYSMHIVYENLKMVVGLTGRAKEIPNGRYSLCPNLGEGNIGSATIALANSSDSTDVRSLFDYPFYDSEFPLENLTNLSVQRFYELILQEKPACFDVN